MSTPPEPPPHPGTVSPAGTRFLTLDQVAEELAVSRSQVYALVRDRSLVALKVGGRGVWRVERSRLEAYIAGLYQAAESAEPSGLPGDGPTGERAEQHDGTEGSDAS